MNARRICLRMLVSVSLALTVVVQSGLAGVRKAAPMDWPHWRGPELNGISREKGLVASWSPDGENLLWKREDLGGRSTPIVMNGKVYLLVRDHPGTLQEGEKVVCVDAKTGKTVWENRFNVYLSDVPNTRVGWSSVVGDPETGHVFALGACGYFQCIDGGTGKTIWSHSLCEEYGLLSTYGGRTNFPIVHDELVIISAIIIGWGKTAKPAHRFIAFDKRNGQAVWFAGTRPLPYDTTYSAPVTAVINGQSALVFASGDGGVHAFQTRTGKELWKYNVSARGINTTPLVVGTTAFCGHSEENLDGNEMGALFAIDVTKTGDITKTGELWRVKEWSVGRSSPLMVKDRLYAIDDKANLLVVDPKDGKLIGKQKLGTMMRSSPLYADGKIYTCTANGRWYILKPSKEGVEIIHRLRLNGEESYGSPIVSHGRIYVPTTGALYCIGNKDQKPQADPRPKPLHEIAVSEDTDAAIVQVVPVESLLRPGTAEIGGQKQQFQVRLYNAHGQFLRLAKWEQVEFSIDGPGSISESGMYTTPAEAVHGAVAVLARVGDLTGDARIRVIPDLPWQFDFNDGQVPVTWIGARYRHIPLDFDLLTSLEKQNGVAAQLYIYLMTGFTNHGPEYSPTGRGLITYNDASPRQAWSALLRFLRLDANKAKPKTVKPKTVEAAKKALGPALELLKKEKVIEKTDWASDEKTGLQLTVSRGPRQIDGNGVMVKISTIPKGARSQSWMGHADLHDFTIQADVMGAIQDDKMPDIGVIAQRYRFQMMGASQQLKIVSWVAHEQKFQVVPFTWKPNLWYTMKFQASVENKDGADVVVLKGKVWPRGGTEPKKWAITWTDTPPNRFGSPGLFGNAKDAEIFYDNVRVTKN